MGQLDFDNLRTDFVLEVISTPLIIFVAWLIVMATRRFFEPQEQRLVQFGFVAHVAGAFAQVTVTREFYGSGDIMVYWAEGVALADALRYDFADLAPRLVQVFLHQDVPLPFTLYGGSGTTASQSVVSAFLQFVTGGSLYGSSVLLSMVALFGKVCLYAAIKPDIPAESRRLVGFAIVLLPSTVYWCGSLSKEAVAIAFFGMLVWSLRRVASRRSLVVAVPLGVFSLIVVAMIKAYILLALSLAGGVWVLWTSQRSKHAAIVVRPLYLVLGALLTLGGMTVVARLNPDYGTEQLQDRATKQQTYGALAGGGSYYELAGGTEEERPLSQQLLLAPAGLFTALFRPLVVEATSLMVFLNSLESTALLVLLVLALWRVGLRRAWRSIVNSPALMFCLVFTVSFGSAVGVLTTNLGTLSRYRAPMMPFFATLVAILWLQAQAERRARTASLARGAVEVARS